MADAEIIPLGTRGRPGRGTGSARPSAAARSLAGGSARKKPAPQEVEQREEEVRTAEVPAVEEPAVEKPATGKPATGKPATEKSAQKSAQKKTSQKKTAERKSGAQPGTRRTAAQRKAAEKRAARPAPAEEVRAGATEAPPRTSPETEARQPAGASGPGSEQPARAASGTTATDRAPGPGIPPGDWLAAFRTGAKEVFGDAWEQRLAEFLAFLRRRLTGDYEVDEYGFDREVTERFLLASLRPLAEKWFRVEVRGIENIPDEGGALVVSNHSGTVPVDGLMTCYAVHDRTGRHLRPLGADLVFRLPVVAAMARKGGVTLACNDDAERMLRGGELVGVWPEGFKGIGKPYSERYKLQRFGRGGFVSAALRTGVPIVPCSVVGAEEIYPLVGNMPTLARLLGVPYIPVTPLFPWLGPLGMVPLPSKWLIEFGEPIRTDSYDEGAADDPMLVFNVTDQVRETIQQTLYSLLMQRRSVFY